MLSKSVGRFVLAAVLIVFGIQGFVMADVTVPWQPVPVTAPGRLLLVYLCASVSILTGLGLSVRRTSGLAAKILLVVFVAWLLVWRVAPLFTAPLVASTWSLGQTLVMIAAAWALYAESASPWEQQHLAFATGVRGLRIATVLYGIGLIPFGYAHFAYVNATADLVPGWLPWHVAWAYFTGATFLAAAIGAVLGLFVRLAVVLSAVQMGLFGLLVWVPRLMAGSLTAFQKGEVATTVVLTAAAWVVADSCRDIAWLRPRNA